MKRGFITILVAISACAALIEWSSCGSSSSSSSSSSGGGSVDAPTISEISISGGNAVPSTVTLTEDPIVTNVSTATSSIVVTFTSTATVTVPADSVTLTCASGTAPTLGTPTASGNVFTFPITGTFPQLTTCTLAFSTAITNGTPMTAVSKNFATGCSTNDNFANATTIATDTGCWTSSGSEFITSTISNATSGLVETLVADASSSAVGLFKSMANGSVTTSVTITNATLVSQSGCGILYANQSLSSVLVLAVLSENDSPGTYFVIATDADGPVSNQITLTTAPSATTPVTLTITAGPSTYSISCSQSGTNCTTLELNDPPLSIIAETTTVGAAMFGSANSTCTFGDGTTTRGFTVSGGSATNGPTGTTGGQD